MICGGVKRAAAGEGQIGIFLLKKEGNGGKTGDE